MGEISETGSQAAVTSERSDLSPSEPAPAPDVAGTPEDKAEGEPAKPADKPEGEPPEPAEKAEGEPAEPTVESAEAETETETASETESAVPLARRIELVRHRAFSSAMALARRPTSRLAFVGALMLSLLAGVGAAGAYVIPRTAPPPVARSATPPAGHLQSHADDGEGDDGIDPEEGVDPEESDEDLDDDLATGARGRPADALAGWAVPLAARLGIPAVALQAYGYAELVQAETAPACGLSWTTLAGIGKVESNHGRTSGSTLGADGKTSPRILGVPLNGTNGHDKIADTDGGRLDGDPSWDRAVGPMQFIPSTWQRYAVDADNDGLADPNDIDDASLAAGAYLCASGKDLSTAAGWYASVLTYNAVRAYAGEVFTTANEYGLRSRR